MTSFAFLGRVKNKCFCTTSIHKRQFLKFYNNKKYNTISEILITIIQRLKNFVTSFEFDFLVLRIPIELPFITTLEWSNAPQKISIRTTYTPRITNTLLIPQRESNNTGDKSGPGSVLLERCSRREARREDTHRCITMDKYVIWGYLASGKLRHLGLDWYLKGGRLESAVRLGVGLSKAVVCLCYHVEPKTQRWEVWGSNEYNIYIFFQWKLSDFCASPFSMTCLPLNIDTRLHERWKI